ncbi:MAG: hypothetical protein ACI9ON_002439 [Limisphaerales bacterium]|jgi:hypothetical protein
MASTLRGLVWGIAVLWLGLVAVTHAEDPPNYRVAASSIEVTPPIGSYLAGYGSDRKSTGNLDAINLKTVVVADQTTTLVLLTLDSIGLTRPDILRIESAIHSFNPTARVIVSSTHTHAGPDVVGIWGPALWRSGRDENYISNLVKQASSLVKKTHSQLVAASSRVLSVDHAFAWVENVSEPDLLDSRLAVLQFVDAQGATIATLTNYACHPTVLGPDNTLVSADYVQGFYQSMSANLSGEHLFFQGAIGGWVQPVQGDRSHELALQIGEQLAETVLEQLPHADNNAYQPLEYLEQTVDIPLDNWGFRLLIWLGVLDRELYDGAMRTEVAWFKIGDAQFVTHPGETSPAYSLASRTLLNTRHSFVLGLTQDAMGYILKPEYFSADVPYPHAEYLTSVSVGETAGPKVMQAIEDIVD